jgi:phospholipid/cholesterol/gamma-HCH transport system substrate-binding protein
MVFGKTKLEMKVGIFVFIGIAILVTGVLMIGKFKMWTSGYHIKVSYNFVNGIKVGAPVRFAGLDVGEVKQIHIAFVPEECKTKITVVGWVRKEVKIPLDSTAWVNTLGLLGEKYLEIMPGKDYAHCLPPEGTLVGIDPIAMHEVVRLAKGITEDIGDFVTKIKNKEGTIGKLLFDDTIYYELEALVKDIRKHPWKLFWKTKEKK